jgi:hypothetical protein
MTREELYRKLKDGLKSDMFDICVESESESESESKSESESESKLEGWL